MVTFLWQFRLFMHIKSPKKFSKALTISFRVSQLKIVIKFLPVQLLRCFNVKVLSHFNKVEKFFAFWFMTHWVYHEVEVIEGEKFTIVCMFFEKNSQSFNREDSLKNMEMLAKEKISLHYYFVLSPSFKRCILFHWTTVGSNVKVIDLT